MTAKDELEQSVVALLEECVDTTPITQIQSVETAEDNESLFIVLEMGNGTDAFITLTPGEPVCVYRTSPPKPPPRIRHLFSVPARKKK